MDDFDSSKPHSDSDKDVIVRYCTKDKTDTVLNAIKIIFYLSTGIGILWNLAYYGLIVKAFPSFNAADIVVYLIAIASIGLFYIMFFSLSFLASGIILFLYSKAVPQKGEPDDLNAWLNEKIFNWEIKNSQLLFLLFAATTLAFIVYISDELQVFLAAILLSHNTPSHILFLCFTVIVIIVSIPNVFFIFSTELPAKPVTVIPIIYSYFIFWGTAVLFSLMAGSMVESTDKTSGVLALVVFIFLSALLNGLIAGDGFAYLKDSSMVNRNLFVRHIAGFITMVVIIITLFSQLFSASKKPNPFLVAPYVALKLGYIDATLTVKDDFAKDLQSTLKYQGSDNNTTFKFKILSSIGTEFIVRPLLDNETKKTLRIPKEKVLLVEYDDEQHKVKKSQ